MKAGDFANAVEMKDSRGTKLRVSQTVVFNQSGVLRVGTIEKFIPRYNFITGCASCRHGRHSEIIVGVSIHVNYGGKKNAICKWPLSVLVINEQEVGGLKISSPTYYEDYEECGYCHRRPFTHHKGNCRQ